MSKLDRCLRLWKMGKNAFQAKSMKSINIKKRKTTLQVTLKVQEEVIPSILDNPIMRLVKWFDDSLSDNIIRIEQQVSGGMRNIKYEYKTWIMSSRKMEDMNIPTLTPVKDIIYAVRNYIEDSGETWILHRHQQTSHIGLYSRTATLTINSGRIQIWQN